MNDTELKEGLNKVIKEGDEKGLLDNDLQFSPSNLD